MSNKMDRPLVTVDGRTLMDRPLEPPNFVVDRILMNFNRTAGLFRSILYTKLFAALLLALSCLGTKGVKGEKITWGRIWTALAAGFVLFFLNWWILALPLPIEAVTGLYILTIGAGYVCLLMGGLWMSRLLKHNLMDDVFNNENESFMQETRLIESEYSVNLPTRFYYKKRWNNGWDALAMRCSSALSAHRQYPSRMPAMP